MSTYIRERRNSIIEAVVITYMATGEPVGSAFIAGKCGLGLSSASIRSIMKSLEVEGFLTQPHTSAGRVPTVKCYRYYVRHLMPEMNLPEIERETLKRIIEDRMKEYDADMFMHHVATVLSEVTDLVGVAVAPGFERGIFNRLEIVNLGGSRYMLIISLKNGLVNTINITLDRIIPRRKIEETARLLTNRLSGLTISEIKKSIGRRLKDVSGGDLKLVEVILTKRDRIFSFSDDRNVHIAGLSRALAHPDFEPVDHSLKLVDMFEHKNEIAKALKLAAQDESDVSIHIGGRGPWGSNPPLSLVSAMYHTGTVAGVIGVIGPARIQYPKLSALMRYAATITSHFYSS
ncbi:MAG: heat-inducible transcription repressor HrcA [Candidatus Latescibacteria bacterium]|jgi:heat-inducible transcriptional repressor|nr:heat-inducible transcription repressor HrcA [Candidatus Latescibacterota bacterium]